MNRLPVFLCIVILCFYSSAGCEQTHTSNKLEQQKEQKKIKNVEPILLSSRIATLGRKPKIGDWTDTNNALNNLQVFKTAKGLLIKFNCDTKTIDDTDGMPPNPAHLLIRIFDEGGQYLTHFESSETFTASERYYTYFDGIYREAKKRFKEAHIDPPDTLNRIIKLKKTGNVVEYSVNRRDLRDASIVEVGFYYPSQ